MATSPLPSWGPKRGRKCYATPTFSGIPNKGEQNQKWSPTKGDNIRSGYLTLAFSGAQKRAEMTHHPHILRDPQQRGAKSQVVPNKGGQYQKWLPHPYLLGGPKEGGNDTSPPHSQGSPTKGSKITSGPQQRGTKSEVATSPLPSWGPKRGRKCYITPTFSGIPNKGEQNQKWSPTKGDKIRSGYLTPTFSGAQKRAEMPHHPHILRDPQQRGTKSEVVPNKGGQNQKWLPHPYLLGGPKEGGNATSPPHSQGSPT